MGEHICWKLVVSKFGRQRLSGPADPQRTAATLRLLLLMLDGTCILFRRLFSLWSI